MRHYFWVFLEKFGVLLLKVFSIVLLARILTPNDFGLYAMVAVIVSIAAMLVDSGMGGALIKKQTLSDLDYSTVFIFNISIGFLLYCLVFFLAPHIAGFYQEQELELLVKLLGVTLIIRSLGLVQVTKLTKELNFKSQSFIFILAGLFSLAIAYYMAVKGLGYWALVGQQIAEAVFTVVAFGLQARYFPRLRFSISLFKEHFAFASRLMLSSVVELLYKNIAIVISGKSLGAGTTGFYSQASKVNEIFIVLATGIVDKTSFPLLVKRVENKDEFLSYASGLLGVTCFICFLCIAVLASCSEPIVGLMLGAQWQDSAWMLHIIALSGYGMIVEAVTRSFLKSQGRSDIILTLSLVKGAISIGILLFLAFWGLKALLWGFVLLSVVYALLNAFAVSKVIDYKIHQQIRDVARLLVVSLITSLCVSCLIKFMGATPIVSLLFALPFALGTYGLLAYFMRVKEYYVLKNYLALQVQGKFFKWNA